MNKNECLAGCSICTLPLVRHREVPRHLGDVGTEIDGADAINDAGHLRAVHARLGTLPAAAQAA